MKVPENEPLETEATALSGFPGRVGGLLYQSPERQVGVLKSIPSPGWHRALGLWDVRFQIPCSLELSQCLPLVPSTKASQS